MVTVLRSTDLDTLDFEPLEAMLPFRLAKITPMDEIIATSMLQDTGSLPLREVAEALGGWQIGRAKAYALHFRRLISIDITAHPTAHSQVRLMPNPAWRRRAS